MPCSWPGESRDTVRPCVKRRTLRLHTWRQIETRSAPENTTQTDIFIRCAARLCSAKRVSVVWIDLILTQRYLKALYRRFLNLELKTVNMWLRLTVSNGLSYHGSWIYVRPSDCIAPSWQHEKRKYEKHKTASQTMYTDNKHKHIHYLLSVVQ